MVAFEDIKADLSDWPDEVIREWLLGLANRADTGWPPPDNVNHHPWGAILGWRPLSWWKNVSWNLEDQDLSFPNLCNDTQQITLRVANEIEQGNASDNSEARVKKAVIHLVQTGVFYAPPVVMKLEDGLSVIDGNHRITALITAQANAELFAKNGRQVPSTTQKVWMGTHANGEVPQDYPDDI